MNSKQKHAETHFGYKKVNRHEKSGLVDEVFHSVARNYDVMNDLMSLGIHRVWKRFAARLCEIRPGQKVLDLAGGTGDLAKLLCPNLGEQGELVIADINASMLGVGRERMIDSGLTKHISFVQCDAERLPFADNIFHCVSIGFGLRNMTNKMDALDAVLRILKPGGRLVILEFSKVKQWFAPIYDTWSFKVIPHIGRLIAQDEDSYRYLAESIRMHPDQTTLLDMMRSVGFKKCDYFNMSHGVVAIHRGYKLP